jgi:hypothetical protein
VRFEHSVPSDATFSTATWGPRQGRLFLTSSMPLHLRYGDNKGHAIPGYATSLLQYLVSIFSLGIARSAPEPAKRLQSIDPYR